MYILKIDKTLSARFLQQTRFYLHFFQLKRNTGKIQRTTLDGQTMGNTGSIEKNTREAIKVRTLAK